MHFSALSPDLTRAYVAEGDQIAILDITDPCPGGSCAPTTPPAANVIARVPVNVTIMGMIRHDLNSTDKKVFIAGGSFGLYQMDAIEPPGGCTPSPTCHLVQEVDDRDDALASSPGPNERWCWDVGIAQASTTAGVKKTYLLALFSAQHDQGGTELRIYRRSNPGAIVAVVKLYGVGAPSFDSRAFGFGLDTEFEIGASGPEYGSQVYIAMGTGGVVRVDLSAVPNGGAPVVQAGQVFPGSGSVLGVTPPTIVTENGVAVPGIARDIAVAEDGSVYAAVDNWGAVELDPTSGLALGLALLYTNGSQPRFAHHIDAVQRGSDIIVGVGGYPGSTIAEAQAPWLSYGRMSYQLGPGGDRKIATVPSTITGTDGLHFYRKPASVALAPSHSALVIGVPLGSTPTNSNLNGGRFIIRPSTTAGEFYFYDQSWMFGGLGSDLDFPTTGAGFHWFKYSVPTFASAEYMEHASRGSRWTAMTRLVVEPTLVLAHYDGAIGATSLDFTIDVTNPDVPVASPIQEPGTGTFRPAARWSTVANEEWYVGAAETGIWGYVLTHVTDPGPTLPPTFERWYFSHPRLPDCYRPRNYHRSTAYLDAETQEPRILGLFDAGAWGPAPARPSAWAGAIYERSDLLSRAAALGYSGTTQPLFPCLQTPGPDPFCSVAGMRCYSTFPNGERTYLAPVEVHHELAAWNPSVNHVEKYSGAFTGPAIVRDYDFGGTPHSVAVIAGGRMSDTEDANADGVADDADFSKAKLVLNDLSLSTSTAVSCSHCSPCCPSLAPTGLFRTSVAYAPHAKGTSASIELVEHAGFTFAIVGDFGGRLLIWDVSQRGSAPWVVPTYRQAWFVPPSMLDGYIDNVADIDVDTSNLATTGVLSVYLAIYRIGIVKLDLTFNTSYDPNDPITMATGLPFALPAQNPASPTVADYTATGVKKRDTPGLAHAIEVYQTSNGPGVLLADGPGGLRLYGNW